LPKIIPAVPVLLQGVDTLDQERHLAYKTSSLQNIRQLTSHELLAS